MRCFALYAGSVLSVLVGAGVPAAAVIVPTVDKASGTGIDNAQSVAGFVIDLDDLISDDEPTLAGPPTATSFTVASGDPLNLNDQNPNLSTNDARDTDGSWSLAYALNTTLNPLGYTITRIDSYAGGTDEARTNQQFELFVSVVGDTAFTSLGTFNSGLPLVTNVTGGGAVSRIRLTDNTGIIATGVDAVRFDFSPMTGQTVFTSHRAIDVIGTPVPEPSMLGAAAIAMAVGAVRRRRRAR